jgi:hypothetical protein
MPNGPVIFALAIIGVLPAGCNKETASVGPTTTPAVAGGSTTKETRVASPVSQPAISNSAAIAASQPPQTSAQ